MRDRHYDASAARFVSRDPIMTNDPRASEPYSYARGNPLMYVDPLGDSAADEVQALQEAISVYVWVESVSNGGDFQVKRKDIKAFLDYAVSEKICTGLCIVEGYALLSTIHNDNQYASTLLAKLFPPLPPPPAAAPPKAAAPPPVVKQPASAASTPIQLAAGSGAGSGSLIAAGTVQAAGLASLITKGAAVISNDGGSLISQDGGGLISQDGGGLISQDGGGLLGHVQ
jgi:hypothetical protein